MNTWRYTAHYQFKALYASEHRSVYLMVQRLHPHPYLALFNGPDTSVTTAVRDSSAVALQALYLLNNPFVHEQSQRLARHLIASASEPAARLRLAYLRSLGRAPTESECAQVRAFLARYEQGLAAEGVPAARRPEEAWAGLARVLLASNEFLYVD